MLTEKAADVAGADRRTTRPSAGCARRPDLLLRGRLGPDARRQGQHHDPRLHVRDGDVRGDPRLLERGPGHGSTALQDPRARRAHPPVLPDPADEGRPVGRRADAGSSSRRSGATTSARTPTSARRSTSRRGRSASGSTTSTTSCTSSPCRSGTTSTPTPGVRVMTSSWRRNAGRGAAGPRQDRRRLREHGLPEVRGRAQRLRRGGRPHGRRPRQRGVGRQPLRRPRRRRAHAAGQRRPARGRDPQGAHGAARRTRASRSRSARSTAPSCTSPTRSSCAGPASRSRRSSRSTTARSARARSVRSARWSATATSTRSAAGCPSTATG